MLPHLPAELTTLTYQAWGQAKVKLRAVKAARQLSLLRRLEVKCLHTLLLLPLTQLTALTSLTVTFTHAYGGATLPATSRLTRLVELHAPIMWPGSVEQLAGLQALRGLTLELEPVGRTGRMVQEEQLAQLGALTQLTYLEVVGPAQPELPRWGRQMAQALPRCLVVVGDMARQCEDGL